MTKRELERFGANLGSPGFVLLGEFSSEDEYPNGEGEPHSVVPNISDSDIKKIAAY